MHLPATHQLDMAAKKKPAATKSDYDEDDFDAADGADWKEEDSPDIESTRSGVPPGVRLRDWRDVERFREERELQRLMREDDLLFDD